MALANVTNTSNLHDSKVNLSDEKRLSSQKKIKEEINQSLVDSTNSSEGSQTSIRIYPLGMSRNIATKLNELSNHSCEQKESNSAVDNEPPPIIRPKKLSKKESGIRATPKQVFPNIACLPSEENIIYCFVLSVWDNIVGPQTVYVWKKKSKPKYLNPEKVNLKDESSDSNRTVDFEATKDRKNAVATDPDKNENRRTLVRSNTFTEGDGEKFNLLLKARKIIEKENHPMQCNRLCLSTVVKYVTEHTVSVGESSQLRANKMIFFYLSVPQQNIIVLSVRFSITEEGVGVPYSLSAVIPIHEEQVLLPALDLIRNSMYRLSASIRLFISKEGLESGDKIRRDLQELCTTLSSLGKANLTMYPLSILARIPDDRRFAERMLTSHLQTMGSSLVIAESPNEANRVVMWLGQFLSENDTAVSRIALSDGMWPFQAGVSLQAVIRDSSGSIDLSSSKLLTSKRPLTVIDLSTNSVRQMAPMNVHSKNSCTTFRMELMARWHDLDHVPAPSQSLFESVEVAAPLVKRFLHEWDTLASCETSVRQSYLRAFLRSLKYTALSIIVWSRREWTKEKKRKDPKSFFQALSSTFLLEEQDIKVILAQVEELQPGFLSTFQKPSKE